MIGQNEEAVLLAIQGLGGESYSSAIQEHVKDNTGRDLSPGTILTTLYRMEEKGFVSSSYSDPLPERGGRRRRMFKIEGLGQRALQACALMSAVRGRMIGEAV